MHTYADEELEEKISLFLDRKTARFPELKPRAAKNLHERHYADIETLTDKIQTLWFKRIHA